MENQNSKSPQSLLDCSLFRGTALQCLALGFAITSQFHILGQTPGSLDPTFNNGSGADGFIRVVAVQPDGKILAGGNFSMVRGANDPLITRLNGDGTLDSNFTSAFPVPVLASRIYTLGIQPDRRILTAGLFTSVGGTLRTNMARLEADGSLDRTFDPGLGPSGLVRILALQPDGRILIGGEFTSVNQTNRNRLARLNTDGSLDTSFDPGTGANDIVRTVVLLPTGQILVGGLFTSFNGGSIPYLVRLNSDGTPDASFPLGSGPNGNVYFISPGADGSLLIGGDFTSVNGTNINRIARLRADGSMDTAFVPGTGVLGGPVYHIIRQNNAKIVIGGGFSSVNGVTLHNLARLNPNGSLDVGFEPGSGASDVVLTMALLGDGRLVAGGLFVTYNGVAVEMLAGIYGDPAYPAVTAGSSDPANLIISWPSWATGYSLQATPQLNPPDWQTVTNNPTLQADHITLSLLRSRAAPSQFYRLILP